MQEFQILNLEFTPGHRDPLWFTVQTSGHLLEHVGSYLKVIINNNPVKVMSILTLNEAALFNQVLQI